jgi:hypothetical protein
MEKDLFGINVKLIGLNILFFVSIKTVKMKENMEKLLIDEILIDLNIVLNLNEKQSDILRYNMASYALAAIMDSSVRKEAENICEEFGDNSKKEKL